MANHGFNRRTLRTTRWVSAWVRRRLAECRLCRECHERVRPLEQTCPHCGAADPARIGLTAGLAVGGAFGLALLLLICL